MGWGLSGWQDPNTTYSRLGSSPLVVVEVSAPAHSNIVHHTGLECGVDVVYEAGMWMCVWVSLWFPFFLPLQYRPPPKSHSSLTP